LQAASSSFLNSRTFLPVLLFSLSLVRCTAGTIWGIPVEELQAQLQRGDASALALVEVTRENAGEAFRLGRQGPYYVAQHLRRLGREEAACELLHAEWEKGAAPWNGEALLELLDAYLGEGRYAEVEQEARAALRRLRDPRTAFLAERLLVEALYWQGKDREVLERLEGLRRTSQQELGGGAAGAGHRDRRGTEPAVSAWDDELELFRAVASCRLDEPGWEGLFVRLFVESRAGPLHGRALAYLEHDELLGRFSAPEQALLRAKVALVGGAPGDALGLLEQALPALATAEARAAGPGRAPMHWAAILFETATAGFSAGDHDGTAGLLQEIAPSLPAGDGLYARELAGRLLRKGARAEEARAILRDVVAASPSPSQRDRAAWFLLDLVRRSGLEPFLTELARLAPGFGDPGYFGDLVDEEMTDLVSAGRWSDLGRLRSALGTAGPASSRARAAYLLGRAAELGLPGAPGRSQAPTLFAQARDADPGGYHSLLALARLAASARSGRSSEGVGASSGAPGASGAPEARGAPGARSGGAPAAGPPPMPDEAEPRAGDPEAGAVSEGEPAGNGGPATDSGDRPRSVGAGGAVEASQEDIALVRGFLSFGLLDEAYELLTPRPDGREDGRRTLALPSTPGPAELPPELLQEAAERLNEREAYLRSIRLMNRYLARGGRAAEPSDLRLLYPRGYATVIDGLAGHQEIDPVVLYALVREESHFDPTIVSSSGAVGLMQLMDDAAADSARRLRIDGYDLRDPETNLRLGAEHFARLLGRLESVPKALMAYNAGLSRVRSWERRYPALPADLLVEAVPYPETRGYIRKILVSAVQYGRLYYGLDAPATALRFYPELGEQEEQHR
jgi:tetratricopeptide (TPR) repeat protein